MFIYLNKKAQSTAEYVIVLGLIISAVIAMQTYIKRNLQGRIKNATDYTGQEGQAQGLKFSGEQYEPYYLQSQFDTQRESQVEENLLGQGAVQRNIVKERSARAGQQTISGVEQE